MKQIRTKKHLCTETKNALNNLLKEPEIDTSMEGLLRQQTYKDGSSGLQRYNAWKNKIHTAQNSRPAISIAKKLVTEWEEKEQRQKADGLQYG